MLHTSLYDLLGVEFPLIQAGMGPFTSARLAAAVSNAGALGSLGAGARSLDDLREQLILLRTLTSRPFAVNHTVPTLNEEAFALTLEARPALVSFALGEPGEHVRRAHEAGIKVMHQVTTVEQAVQAAALGVDIINAQGGEAGGFAGAVATSVLVPQVVDAVCPLSVVASGGIADGRGLAAALVLGAQGVNLGTRFLACVEAPISDAWKRAILAAAPEDTVKLEAWSDVFPLKAGDYPAAPRVLRSSFVDEWLDGREDTMHEAERLRAEVMAAIREGRFGEILPFTGQSAGLIQELLPAAEIVRRMMAETERALARYRDD
jgi:enoyl-[acyl-carrier protein] reductase II